MNTNLTTKPGKNGYKIVFATNTVVMNYKFAAAAAEYGTKEYKIMMDNVGLMLLIGKSNAGVELGTMRVKPLQ